MVYSGTSRGSILRLPRQIWTHLEGHAELVMTSSSCRSWTWKIGSLSIWFLDKSFNIQHWNQTCTSSKWFPNEYLSPCLQIFEFPLCLDDPRQIENHNSKNPQIHELLPSITIWVGGSTDPGLPGVFWGQAAVWVQQHSVGHRYQGQAADRGTRNWRRRPTGAWEAMRVTISPWWSFGWRVQLPDT